ncbi:hypothetical protein KFL_000240220 [Klebsormidium nitens]|uniref:Glutaredoxin domain-containing protein n=1 Tax=Klebsormidium nitens TaxID=105231 RepID=A0A1Y1HQ30_KLENI|nr:hypothetical protein KFL_000240220 [Klebsormidium nitens]|eukprot:GAQ79091.1 hypothetical protein KFL_000240220 [Klebsormidium nitens]
MLSFSRAVSRHLRVDNTKTSSLTGFSFAPARWIQGATSSTTDTEAGEADTHDDFKPRYKKEDEIPTIHQLIEEDVKGNPVMVYMKGVPDAPMCGFSRAVVQILKAYEVPFSSRNVLQDEELRQGVKSYSKWPTIPQVYVNGEFIGGCDILVNMSKTGELEPILEEAKKAQSKRVG